MKGRIDAAKTTFRLAFGSEPAHVFTSCGRMELVGNHTDHQGGAVLVAAIDLTIVATVSKRDDNLIILVSDGYPRIEVALDDLEVRPKEFSRTSGIIRGVAARFVELGYLIGGLAIAMNSTIRAGSGVSSSASVELLIGMALSELYNDGSIDRVTLAKIAQRAENKHFGKPSGLLDQMGIALGGINYIEFENRENPYHAAVPFPFADLRFLIINTGGSHTDLTHHYSLVKDEMLAIAAHFGKTRLIEVSPAEFQIGLPELIKRYGLRPVNRAIHFFQECEHVRLAKSALETGNRQAFLRWIRASGRSSEQLLENITYQGDQEPRLAEGLAFAQTLIGNGAVRVHGGGFAGTILAVVPLDELAVFKQRVSAQFGAQNVSEVAIEPTGLQRLA